MLDLQRLSIIPLMLGVILLSYGLIGRFTAGPSYNAITQKHSPPKRYTGQIVAGVLLVGLAVLLWAVG